MKVVTISRYARVEQLSRRDVMARIQMLIRSGEGRDDSGVRGRGPGRDARQLERLFGADIRNVLEIKPEWQARVPGDRG